MFVGEAGVGKTALAEGLAQRLLQDDVPLILEGRRGLFPGHDGAPRRHSVPRRLRGALQGRRRGAGAQGKKPILFIDEVHATVGAGATTGGTMDLATLIKPVLKRGELRVVGSTTFEEFKQIEKDRGLARRLQKIVVDEPTVEETVRILKGLRSRYEVHHNVKYPDAALEAAAKLAARHLRDSRLPDSAIDILDEAGAMLRLRAQPAPSGDGTRDSRSTASAATAGETAENIEAPPRRTVDVEDIEHVMARMARIPEKQATASDKERLKGLEEALNRVVFGQSDAVRQVATSIKRARAGLGQPDKPAGCFLFTGPTGVGKTELAKQLARHLGQRVLALRHERVHGEACGGAAHRRARRATSASSRAACSSTRSVSIPYSVLLLDEIEKAHPDCSTSCCR